jgi:formylglycine-generating enzyme required for sulfatase activity
MDSVQEHGDEPKAQIFVFHSHGNMAFEDRLKSALKARGFDPSSDPVEINAFENWWEHVEGLIGRAETAVFVLSPRAGIFDAPKGVALSASCPAGDIQPFVAESRQSARLAEGRHRFAHMFTYTLLIGIIIGLVGWINQSYIKEQWNWYTTLRPFAAANIWPYVLTADAERALEPQASFRECTRACPEMIVLSAGTFTMGSPPTEQGHYDNEGPQREIMIAKRFAVSKFDVTFADWDACVSLGGCHQVSDSGMGYDTKPVINISWDDAQQYVAWLSKMTGKHYRLLTEAEWEYAARGGGTTAYYWGEEIGKRNANCNGCGSRWEGELTAPVGSFAANQLGLYDMAGNVWQWTEDCYHHDYNGAPTDGSAWISGDCGRRVVRGGAWDSSPQLLRSAVREGNSSERRVSNLGFRIGRTLSSR